MNIPTVNTIPISSAVKMADIIGIKVGCTLEYLKSINDITLHKELMTPDRYHYLTLIEPFSSTLDLLNIPEGYIVISNKPFVIYCLKDKGLSKLALEVSQLDKLSNHRPILLSEGSWFFFLHQEIPGYKPENDYNPSGRLLKIPIDKIKELTDRW